MNWEQLLSLKRAGDKEKRVRNKQDETRLGFDVDFDRIVFSSSFRSLQDKTQVIPVSKTDFVHTRLTHSMEVSVVGRSLGRIVGQKIIEKYPELKDLGYTFNDFGAIVAAAALILTNPDALFNVIKVKPTMWISFICIYSFLSVIPQEIIYRSFYFERYKKIFPNKTLFIFSNALVFSLGHIFFNNLLVSVITFIGGLIFAYTYKKTKSMLLVSIEHAIYGCWLYTVGFGEILGFPSP